MARRRGTVVGRIRPAKRQSIWLQFQPISVTLAAASAAQLVFVLNAAALALRPFTIVRTRGLMSVISDQAAATESQQVGLGVAVVSTQASAAGIASVPTAFLNMESDLFFVYENVFQTLRRSAANPDDSLAAAVHRFDSKAMRKIDIGQDLAVTLENSAIASGSITIMAMRMLAKLH